MTSLRYLVGADVRRFATLCACLAVCALGLVPARATTFVESFDTVNVDASPPLSYAGDSSFSLSVAGVAFNYTFETAGGGGVFYWGALEGEAGSSSVWASSTDSDLGTLERITIARADGAEFVLNSLYLWVHDLAAPVTVELYRQGVLVGSPTTLQPSDFGTVSFGGIVVDEVRFSSNDFIFVFDTFTGDTNTPPVIANLHGDSVTYTEGGSPVLLDAGSDATVTDSTSADLGGGGLSAAVVANGSGTEDVLSIKHQGAGAGEIGVSGGNVSYGGVVIGTVTGGTNGNDLVVTFNASATPAAVQALVRALTYENINSTEPSTLTRTVRVAIDDGDGAGSNSCDIDVTVVGVNDAPTLTATGGSPTFTEGGLAVSLFSAASVSTVESGQSITALTLTVANLADGSSESLAVDGSSFALTDGSTGTTSVNDVAYSVSLAGSTAAVSLTKAGGLTTATVASVIDGMTYQNTSDAPSTTNRVVTLASVSDSGGTANSGVDTSSLAVAATVSIVAVNDAPVVLASGGTTTFTESTSGASAPVVIDPGISVTDVDSSTLASATVSITGNLQVSEDALAFTNTNATTYGNVSASYVSGTGVLSLTSAGATATLAQWEAALRAVTYTNSSESPSTATRTVTVQISDGVDASTGVTKSVGVVSTNDAPVSTVPAEQTIDADGVLEFSTAQGTLIALDDVDAGSNPLQVTLTASNGVLTLAGTTGLSFSVGDGSADVALTFAGTLAAINTALDGMSFMPTAGFHGSASVQISTNDQGYTGAGGAQVATDSVPIIVQQLTPSVVLVDAVNVDGVYGQGDEILIIVGFDTAVTVDTTGGTPSLLLETGATDRSAFYVSGSGSSTLVFSCTVEAGDISADLEYTSTTALTLDGATIRSSSDGDAVITLPALGSADSLGGRSDLVVDGDTQAPTLTAPATGAADNATLAVAFAIPETPQAGTIKLTFVRTSGQADDQAPHVLTFVDGATVVDTVLDGTDLGANALVASVSSGSGVLVDGAIYTVTLSYQDAVGNPEASASSTGIIFDKSIATPDVPALASSSDTGVSDSDGITRQTAPTLVGTAETGSSVEVLVDGVTAGITTADFLGAWSFTASAPWNDGEYLVSVRATDGAGNVSLESPAASIVIDTAAPVVTSSATASGTFGSPFAYTISADGSPAEFSATALPSGLSIDPATGIIAGTPAVSGDYVVTIGASDAAGNQGIAQLSIAIAKAAQTITFDPIARATVGTPVSLSATAGSGLAVTFSVVEGDASVTGDQLTVNSSGTVTVRATQAGNGVYDAATADQTVGTIAKLAQTITFAQPASRSVVESSFALGAVASSGLPVSYAVLSGPASASANMVTLSGAPGRVVVVAEQAGNGAFEAATPVARSFAVISPVPYVGFGVIRDALVERGTFAVCLEPDGESGTIVGHVSGFGGFAVAFAPDADGAFVVTAEVRAPGAPAPEAWTIRGQTRGGAFSGAIDELNYDLIGAFDPASGSSASMAGHYIATALDTSTGQVHTMVGTTGTIYVLVVLDDVVEGSVGSVDGGTGGFVVVSGSGATVDGVIRPGAGTLPCSYTRATGGATEFAGLIAGALRTDRLINLSSRAAAGIGDNVVIAGFVISGAEPKQVLLRAVGPGLVGLGVDTAVTLADPHVTLMQAGGPIASNDDWGLASNAAAISDAIVRTGAFDLASGSKDAALLITLAPGAYTAVIDGNGGTGVTLAEVYDASETPTAEYQRLINISTRGPVGPGDATLIGGFVVTGNAPKRVLVRGVGPGLALLGVAGTLTDPSLTLFHGDAVVAANSDWGTGANSAAQLATAAATVGAFAVEAGSKDAALLITLAPGAYTVHVTSATAETGIALVEVYEVP